MKKSTKIAIIVVAIIAIIAVVVAIVMNLSKDKSKDEETSKLEEVTSAKDLEKLVDKLYEGDIELPSLQTMEIETTDDTLVQSFTGLENGKDLEYLVVSEPLINAQAYSLVIAKVKDGVDVNKVAKDMSEKIDMRKWICVSAEKVYSTSSGDVVFLIMSSEETAKPIYEKFKSLAGTVGKEYVKEESEIDLPPEML